VPLAGFVFGLGGCVALYAVMKVATVSEWDLGRYTKVAIGFACFMAIGLGIGSTVRRLRHPRSSRLSAVGFGASLLGVAAAVVLWNLLEDVVFARVGTYPVYQERTLFPFDIALLWFFGSLPIIAGIIAGGMMGGERK